MRAAVDDPPTRIGGHEILGEIGRGGMGVVYLAHNELLKKTVALKTIRPGFPTGEATLRMFRREIEAAVAVEHSGITPILQAGEEAGQLYFTMPLFEASLAQRLEDFRAPRAAARLGEQLARAVQHAHDCGVLHLDLKPANVLLDPVGSPHVADFGLAKLLRERRPGREASAANRQAAGGASAGRSRGRSASRSDPPARTVGSHLDPRSASPAPGGTPCYMAPEQVANAPRVTTATDVYGLGLILYETLAGQPAFDEDSRLAEIGRATPRALRLSALDRDLEAICMHCLEPEPEKRYRSAVELADDLAHYLRREPVTVRPLAPWERAWRFALQRPLVVLAAVSAAVLVTTVVSDLLRIAETQRAELRTSVLRANEWAAKVASDALLYLLRERMEWVEQMAQEPLMAELAAGRPVADAPQLEPYQRARFDIVVVLDRRGVLNAIWPKGKRDVVGLDYAWRDYFRSSCDPEARDVVPGAYIARSFESENDDDYNLSISAPIVRGGRCEGVVLTTLLTDAAIGPFRLIPRGDPRHKGVLLGPQDRRRNPRRAAFPEPYLVLLHDRMRSAQGVSLPLDLSRRLRAAFGPPSPRGAQLEASAVPPILDDAYLDPLSDPSERWLVAFRPVGGTGFVVGVQTRDDLVEAPIVTLSRGLVHIAALVGVASLVAAGAGALVRRRGRTR